MKVILLIIVSFVSCTRERPKLDDIHFTKIADDDCFNSYTESKENNEQMVHRISKSTLGHSASYFVTGLGYMGDLVIYTIAGVGVGFVICTPAFIIDSAFNGDGNFSGECVGRMTSEVVIAGLSTASLGREAYHKSKKWRCDDYRHIAEGLREVASCYKSKGEIDKAKMQLEAIRENKILKRCL